MQHATIKNRFQIRFPLKIHKKTGLKKHTRDIFFLAGSIKPKKGIDIDNIRDYIDYSDL